MTETPRIYVACLASYNNGILHGEWIDLDGSEDLSERIAEILESSSIEGAEEYAVHDYEYCGALGEYPGFDRLESLQEAFTKVASANIGWELFCEFCEHLGEEIKTNQIQSFEDSYAGCAGSLVDWCHEYLEETGTLEIIPESLRSYFNIEAYARDVEINEVFTIEHNSECHVFRNI